MKSAGNKADVSPEAILPEGVAASAGLTLPLSAAPDVKEPAEPLKLEDTLEQQSREDKAEAEQPDEFWLPEEIAQEPKRKCPADVQVLLSRQLCKNQPRLILLTCPCLTAYLLTETSSRQYHPRTYVTTALGKGSKLVFEIMVTGLNLHFKLFEACSYDCWATNVPIPKALLDYCRRR